MKNKKCSHCGSKEDLILNSIGKYGKKYYLCRICQRNRKQKFYEKSHNRKTINLLEEILERLDKLDNKIISMNLDD